MLHGTQSLLHPRRDQGTSPVPLHVLERVPSPELQCPLDGVDGVHGEGVLEFEQVGRDDLPVEDVTRSAPAEGVSAVAQLLPQVRDIGRDGAFRSRSRFLTPHGLDDAVGRNLFTEMGGEHGEDRLLLVRPEVDGPPTLPRHHRTQHRDTQGHARDGNRPRVRRTSGFGARRGASEASPI